ncbi:hypothetical protein B296_00045988 [Ensete ventricosum]|uniref:Uncharacterized protein n=1 Tax=Ensete ventricosum TaxID=4639 RepID=A0A426XHT6_ENSVE|nr:hypothetical protein B296_00045988 [Ensete ventricosum]
MRGNARRRDGLTWRCLLLKGRLAYSLGDFAASSGSRNDAVYINLASMVAKDHFSFSSFLSFRASHLSVTPSLSASLPIRSEWRLDFGIEWSAHPISNVLLKLSDEEANMVERLKGILSASRAVRNLNEEWLVEAGLSPASRGMHRRRSPHKADRASKGKGPADTLVEPPAPRQRPKLMRELCSARADVDGRDYHAIRMCNLLEQAFDAPLDPDLRPLTHGTLVWQRGEASATYIRGVLLPRLASDLYTLPSEVLMDGAAKAMVLRLRIELDEANNCRASIEAELEKSRSESTSLERQLADLRERLGDSEGQFRSARARVRQMETELLDLARSNEALREDLSKRAIEESKELPGFEMGLVQMGRVSTGSVPTIASTSVGRDRVGPIHHPSRGCRRHDGEE